MSLRSLFKRTHVKPLRRHARSTFVETLEDRLFLAAQAYDWQNVAINGGGFVTGIITNPSAPGLMYARTDVGGAYRWDNANSKWMPLQDSLTSDDWTLMGVDSIASDPVDPNRVYMACGEYTNDWGGNGAVLASSDRGDTWNRVNMPFKFGGNEDGRSNGERMAVDPNSNNIIYMGTRKNGLWKSIDFGATWNQVSFPITTTQNGNGLVFVQFVKSSGIAGSPTPTIYIGASQTRNSLYKSTNGGATWAAVSGAPSRLMPHHAALAADGSMYLTYNNAEGPNNVSSGAVWKLNVNTGAWTNVSPPTVQGGFGGVSLDAQHPGTLVVSTIDCWYLRDDVYRSTNGGSSWTALRGQGTNDFAVFGNSVWSSTLTPHWLGDIEIDPFNSNRVLFTTGYGIWASNDLTVADSGQPTHWTFTSSGLEETVVQDIAAPPGGAALYDVIGDFNGFRHDDVTVPPTAPFANPNLGSSTGLDFAELNPNYVVRVGSTAPYGGYSTNGGVSWTPFSTSPTGTTGNGKVAVAADGSRIVWVPAGAGAYYSTNNGATWSTGSGLPAGLTPVADRVNPLKFYAYDGPNAHVYLSANGGATWTLSPAVVPQWGGNIIATPGHEGDVWMANSSGLFHSLDSGVTFTQLMTTWNSSKVALGAPAPGQTYPAIYVIGYPEFSALGFHRSDDGGATWGQINDSQHWFGGINEIAGDPDVYGRLYIATQGRGIVYGDISSGTVNAAPTVATPASASPSPVSGTTTNLSVLGADDAGESKLTYTWAATGPAAVTYSANGTNGAKNSVATFTKAGSYSFTVTLRDAGGLTVTSSVNITVNQTLTIVDVTPATASIAINATQQFTATAYDQFGVALTSQPTFTWSLASGGGTVSASGLYTAPGTAGSATVRALTGSLSDTAAITIVTAQPPAAPTNLTAAKVQGKKAKLTWTDNATNETGFYVWSSRDGVTWSLMATVGAGSVSYTSSLLATGTWYFKVTAYNANGESAATNVATLLI